MKLTLIRTDRETGKTFFSTLDANSDKKVKNGEQIAHVSTAATHPSLQGQTINT